MYFYIYTQQAHAQAPVYSVRMRMGVKHPSLICFLTFFYFGKPVLVGQSGAALEMLWLYEGVHTTTTPCFCTPQTGVGMGRRPLANGLFNNASRALPPRRAVRKTYRITQPLLPTLTGALN